MRLRHFYYIEGTIHRGTNEAEKADAFCACATASHETGSGDEESDSDESERNPVEDDDGIRRIIPKEMGDEESVTVQMHPDPEGNQSPTAHLRS